MYRPSIWDSESSRGRQEYIGAILIKNRESVHMMQLARVIDRMSREYNMIPETTYVFHNSRYRRILTSDIDKMNRDRSYHFIIASDSDGAKIASKEDAAHMIGMLRGKALKSLAKAAILAEKAGLDCQLDINGNEIKTFLEGENE